MHAILVVLVAALHGDALEIFPKFGLTIEYQITELNVVFKFMYNSSLERKDWIAIGFGKDMASTKDYLVVFPGTQKAEDRGTTGGQVLPVIDAVQNLAVGSSDATSISVLRLLSARDPADFTIDPFSTSTDCIWAHGTLGAGTMLQHQATDRGTCVLNLAGSQGVQAVPVPQASNISTDGEPLLMYSHAGCTCDVAQCFCERGWYSSPAYFQEKPGVVTVVGATSVIRAIHGDYGTLVWEAESGHDVTEKAGVEIGRTWPSVVLLPDVYERDNLGIITGHVQGQISLYDRNGKFMAPFRTRVLANVTGEVRSLSVAHLSCSLHYNGYSLVVGVDQREFSVHVISLTSGGDMVGYPKGDPTTHDPSISGYVSMVQGENIGIVEFNPSWTVRNPDASAPDRQFTVVVPGDGNYINAFALTGGAPAPVSPTLGGKSWGTVGTWEDEEWDFAGTADCVSENQTIRPNFFMSAVSSFQYKGRVLIAIVGDLSDCSKSLASSAGTGHALYVFDSNRARYQDATVNWSIPFVTGSIWSRALGVRAEHIEDCAPNVAIGDLDGDGLPELVFPAYDGKVYAVSFITKNVFKSWPYDLYESAEFDSYASEVAIADLDNDGKAEVIFNSWTDKKSRMPGKLYIINYDGTVRYRVNHPANFPDTKWGGAMAAPTIGNIDITADLEVVIQTAFHGLIAYTIPKSSSARVWWGTGRGSFLRSGTNDFQVYPAPALPAGVDPNVPVPLPAFCHVAPDVWEDSSVLGSGSVAAIVIVLVALGCCIFAAAWWFTRNQSDTTYASRRQPRAKALTPEEEDDAWASLHMNMLANASSSPAPTKPLPTATKIPRQLPTTQQPNSKPGYTASRASLSQSKAPPVPQFPLKY